MKRVSHHGRGTAYRRSARTEAGPGLLCIHGSGGAAGVWKSQSRLADRTPVTAMDLSDHGESGSLAAQAGYEALSGYADDAVAVAEETGARVLCGNSLGAAVALTVALDRDLAIDGLVLTGAGARLPVLDDLLVWLDSDFDRAIEFLHGPDRLFHDPNEELVGISEAAMRDTGRETTARDFRTCHEFDVRERLDEIDVPMLAVVGEHDKLTPPHYHEALAGSIPDSEVVTVDDAAHLAMLEQPGAFNDAVESFLDRF
ncbi:MULTISPECIES: alpha/beta fold hydrolase [Halolamina]|uniref:Pimeloyl-ACP methyl ester carboxylesterase n=1 Tax=Halolamina pelagica TaxID=699431 RepID=A0A1I5Q095_9EURY|nr:MULTISPECIES: alpha/beta hydrolase [Halolamina]NHX35041.1 alpha/beta hydrolase [Halolamina sp. R1-12]SFP39748.1 Pimeloyl-ACP methyl ester carboxylesterase [Halolamina pelagica]